ncbi:MAG TPA: response regulator transcription factor [Cellulomonas sp.]
MRILVADDDAQLVRALSISLRARGYEVVAAADGVEAIAAAVGRHPDIVLLDLGMPRMDGYEVIEGIRGWSEVPILVVSGRAREEDKVRALDAGADDYVTKPFEVEELLARIRALTRRMLHRNAGPVVRLGDVTVDFAVRRAVRTATDGERPIRLTSIEWQVLEMLVRAPGELHTREEVLETIWGSGRGAGVGDLRFHVSQLRKKLEPDPSAPRFLVTEPGLGYRLVPGGPGPVARATETPA